MRDRMERFVILPFSVGCVSESSVAVAEQQPRRSSKPAETAISSTATRTLLREEEDEESLSSTESMKYSLKFPTLPKPDISNGFHRLVKSFKTLSQLFVYKEEMEEDSEKEIEIGLPTDVKHVTHIGMDGSASTSPSMGSSSWDNLFSPRELFTFPSVPNSGQCELPMETPAAAAAAAASPLVQASTT